MKSTLPRVEEFVFRHRVLCTLFFVLVTVLLGVFAARTRVDASFNKSLPSNHEYIQTFIQYQAEFGGANRVVIALMAREGDIFTPDFFATLEAVTDKAFYLPGVDRAQVQSIFTPNVRYLEVVEDGLQGGNVIPPGFAPTPEGFEQVRQNIIKSGRVGMLVSSDFTGAAVIASLLEVDPQTGAKLDYTVVAKALETTIRERHGSARIDIHIIGFAQVIGDITEGATGVFLFFFVAIAISALLLFFFSQSLVLTLLPLFTSACAVIWQLGLLNLLGFGLDPLSMLVPFLVFAIALSHATQMLRSFRHEYTLGANEYAAARASFSNLFVPGTVAIVTDTVGFLTIYLIDIPIIRELAITASLGVMLIIFTDRFFLPLLLSWTRMKPNFRRQVNFRRFALQPTWRRLVTVTTGRGSILIIAVCLGLWVFGLVQARKVPIGDVHAGVPELRVDSRYNRDTAVITSEFAIGADTITVLVETVPNGVIDHDVMALVDRFASHLRGIEGVQSTLALTDYAKTINAGWNEGSLKWRVIPRNPQALAQAVAPVETSSGLLNADGSVIPVMIYLKDHRAETLQTVVAAIKEFREAHGTERARFRLATGNAGVMAATNEVVAAAQIPMMVWLYAAVVTLCLLSFRSWRATVCVVLPLVIVSDLAYALMVALEIGLKPSTLPVVALGAGIGVDYGIYLSSAIMEKIRAGRSYDEALVESFATMGTSIVFTGFALAIGVGTWAFSALKFQADMGLLLAFMFLFNMLGAMLLLPALGRWLFPRPVVKA
jgi:uncharacterized protein